MTSMNPLPYSLDVSCPIPWSVSAESQLHQDYPFLDQENTGEDFVIRRYLETLWLPESFNPLSHLIASLRRVAAPDDNMSAPHPLHSLLEPLLLPIRAASDKYRTELVQILVDGGGAGEREEMMMWFAWEYERMDGQADEEKWRNKWLERLERREAMIQILLTMLKLSLPAPPATKGEQSSKKKKKKRGKSEPPPETDEERLESYMDKLAVWQLTASLDELASASAGTGSSMGKAKADRHWTQVFCEDVAEPLFKAELPTQCALFRSKVFPTSPFSDAEDSDAETVLDGGNGSRAASRTRSLSRKPSTLSRAPSVAASDAGGSSSSTLFSRSRSRSLSVSLAQDEATQRASFVEPKRALSREVSMNRVFKAKPKPKPKPKLREEPKPAKPKVKRDAGVTLVADTPVKRKRADSLTQDNLLPHVPGAVLSPPRTSPSSPDVTHIEDTPVLARRTTERSQLERQDTSLVADLSPLSPLSPANAGGRMCSTPKGLFAAAAAYLSADAGRFKPLVEPISLFKDGADDWLDENADDSFTGSFGSPDVLLLGDEEHSGSHRPNLPSSTLKNRGVVAGGSGQNTRRLSMRMDDEYAYDIETPTKKRTRRQ
ncbi:hypothetical protein M0805_002866 [Coniferiporia weirii]|nr:hypothetical protein M0805_002866 [Coniferiporia weirii]